MPDRGGPTKVHIVLPAYKASATIPTVAKEIPVGAADRALLVDDASPDDTTGVALQEGFEVIRHPGNRGYGANQMTCYTRAILDGADIVVMVHADNQYDPTLVSKMVRPIERGEADVVIGSRLLEDEAIAGGMPRWKWVGNRFLTWIENRAFRTGFSEFHTGYRAFSADILREIAFLRNSDGFVFDQEIFAQLVRRGARVHEIAIPTRYFLEASSVSFTRSVEYGLRTLVVLAASASTSGAARWPLVRHPARACAPTAVGAGADAGRRAAPEPSASRPDAADAPAGERPEPGLSASAGAGARPAPWRGPAAAARASAPSRGGRGLRVAQHLDERVRPRPRRRPAGRGAPPRRRAARPVRPRPGRPPAGRRPAPRAPRGRTARCPRSGGGRTRRAARSPASSGPA